MLAWSAMVAGCFAGSLVLHAMTCRLQLRADRVVRFLVGGSLTGLLLLLLSLQRYGWLALETVAAALVYAFLCELYLFLFTMTISSVSANLLVRLRSGGMALTDIERHYDSRQMVRVRIGRLANTGFLHLDGDRIFIDARGFRLLRVFRALRGFFGIRDAGS